MSRSIHLTVIDLVVNPLPLIILRTLGTSSNSGQTRQGLLTDIEKEVPNSIVLSMVHLLL